MLKLMADRLGELFSADGCFITLWDENREEARPAAACGPYHETYRSSPPEGKEITMTSSVLKARRALVAENVHDSPLISPKIAALFPACSLLGLPLIANGQKLGAALIAYQTSHHFTSEEIARGEQAAGQIALAISKALLLDSERRRRQEAETLRTVSNALVSTLELDQVLDLILDQLARVIDYDSAAVLLLEEDNVRVVTGHGFKDSTKFLGRSYPIKDLPLEKILETQRALWLENPRENTKLRKLGWTKNIQSWMALPMWAPGELIGFMTLDSYQPDAYGASEAALVQPYANQAAQAIENARRFDWVQRQALTDDLTGLYNRRGLFQLGRREVERADRFERPLTAIMIDIDHFKRVNDRYGHYIGDQVLCEIARRCTALLRKIDLLGRYGGEEFAILLPETAMRTAMEVAERIRKFIADETVKTGRGDLSITISLGVAQLTNDTTELARLLDAADTAMYTAKQAGRNCVKEYKKGK
jgi:diguanylate cyclase (GGDEF)-like protein